MKKNLTKIIAVILMAAFILCLVPTFTKRINVEDKNTNVVVSLYYNDIANRLRGKKLDKAIADFKKIGVTTMSFSEENLNSMVARGDITNIKYNVLRHKYDDESIELANLIAKEAPDIIYDSQLIITKDKETADFLSNNLPLRYTQDKEFKKITHINDATGIETTVFCIYDGTFPTNDVKLGFNENVISKYSDQGFDICLILHLSDTTETGYIDNIQRLIDNYNISHISIRAPLVGPAKEKDAKEHYTAISKLIEDNDLTLVITENASQLSNESPSGYKHIFGNNNSKVMRSYETYDASQVEATRYMFRYHQYLNSTIDRNIRFITVSQIHLSYTSYEKCTEYTLKAVKEYIKKITELGYTVNGEVPVLDYDTDLRIPNAVASGIMVLMIYLMLTSVFNIKLKLLFPATLVLTVLALGAGFVMPEGLQWAFPTAWAVLAPCFALTVLLSFIKNYKDKLATIPLIISSVLLLSVLMSILGIVQSSLLSGINYYVNNSIFRGIKLSLFLPLVYALAIYILFFVKIDIKKITSYVAKFKITDIKFTYIITAVVLLFIGYSVISVYIRRSGNVNSISKLEAAMRNFITDVFEARPRTKEFLIGYPCLTLFIYYLKKTNIKLIQACLFCGAAITAASISNTFCHVFTTVEIIYGRVMNGVILGVICSVAAYVVNLILVKIVSKLFTKYALPWIKTKESVFTMYKMFIGERN